MNFRRKPGYLPIGHELICRYTEGCEYLLCSWNGNVIYYLQFR